MTRHRSRLLFLTLVASATCALAQETPPTADPTDPSAASSPHQRKSTTTPAEERDPTSGAKPADASSPHQRQATKGDVAEGKASQEQMLKDCVKKEQARDSSMSKEEAKKTCMEQMNMEKMDETEGKPY